MPPEAAEAGADQRLPVDGGGVHQKPGADEASGREAGGQSLRHMWGNYRSAVIFQ